jgi:hypothetical protein
MIDFVFMLLTSSVWQHRAFIHVLFCAIAHVGTWAGESGGYFDIVRMHGIPIKL